MAAALLLLGRRALGPRASAQALDGGRRVRVTDGETLNQRADPGAPIYYLPQDHRLFACTVR